MKFFPALSMTLLASALAATAAPRFALVRVKEIYAQLPSTLAFQQQIKSERDAVMKDLRADNLRKAITELQAVQAQLSDKSHPLDETANRLVARTYELKRQEAQSLQADFESFKAEQEKAINRKLVAGMRAALGRIVKTSQEIAKKQGFHMVLDSSGNTNSGVPFILSHKAAPDLTAEILTTLQAAEPTASPEKSMDAPAKTR